MPDHSQPCSFLYGFFMVYMQDNNSETSLILIKRRYGVAVV